MAVSTPHVLASNYDFDDYWEPYARFLEGRIVQVIRQQEISVQEEFGSHLDLIENLKISIPKECGNYEILLIFYVKSKLAKLEPQKLLFKLI